MTNLAVILLPLSQEVDGVAEHDHNNCTEQKLHMLDILCFYIYSYLCQVHASLAGDQVKDSEIRAPFDLIQSELSAALELQTLQLKMMYTFIFTWALPFKNMA